MPIKKRPVPPKLNSNLRGAERDAYDKALLQSTATKPMVKVTVSLDHLFKKAIDNDADEIIIRIAQYAPDLTPGTFQAIVKFSDRTRAWASVVHENPEIAFVDAMLLAGKMPGPTMQQRVKPNGSEDTAGSLRKRADGGKQPLAGKAGKPAKRIIRRT